MFAAVSRYPKGSINLPERKTKASAGYDFEISEDIIIPSYHDLMDKLESSRLVMTPSLGDIAILTKETGAKPTLVPTGIKCYMSDNQYLELSVRSSCPLKHWLVLANGVGIIDADYVDNEDNEGEIFFQIINLAPFPIQLHKGDIIGQGILKNYLIMDDDTANGERTGGFGSTDIAQTYCVPTGRGNRAKMSVLDDYMNSSTVYGNYSQAEGAGSQAYGVVPTDKNVELRLDYQNIAQAVGNAGMTTAEAVEAIKQAMKDLNNSILTTYKGD